jgi:hypothetical protein
MPIQDPANVSVTTVYGTHTTIGSAIETALQGLNAATEIFDITVIKLAVGNNFAAYISYEAPPPAP